MPTRVPVYGGGGAPTVEQESLSRPNQRVPPDLRRAALTPIAEGMQAAEGLAAAGRKASEIRLLEIAETNEIAVKTNLAEYQRHITNELHNPETGFLQLRGERAREGQEDFTRRLGEYRDKLGAALPSQNAREMWDRQILAVDTGVFSTIESHVGQEHQRALSTASEQRIEANRNAAIFAYNPVGNNDQYDIAMSTIETEARDHAANFLGLTGDDAQLYVRDQIAGAHAGVVGHLIAKGRGTDARDYFNANKDDFTDAEVRSRVEAAIESAVIPEDALALAISLPADQPQAQAILDRKYKAGEIDAARYQAASAEVAQRAAIRRQADAEAKQALANRIEAWAVENRGKTINQMPRDLYVAARGLGMLDNAQQLLGSGVVDDSAAMAEVLSMTPAQLAALGPQGVQQRYAGVLTPGNLEQSMRAAAAARGGVSASPEGAAVVTTSEMVQSSAYNLGLIPQPGGSQKMSETQAKEFLEFQRRVQRILDDTARRAGKSGSTRADIEAAVRAVEQQYVFDDVTWGRDVRRPLDTLSAEQQASAYVQVGPPGDAQRVRLASIPANFRQRAANDLRRRGIPVSEQKIAELWLAQKGR